MRKKINSKQKEGRERKIKRRKIAKTRQLKEMLLIEAKKKARCPELFCLRKDGYWFIWKRPTVKIRWIFRGIIIFTAREVDEVAKDSNVLIRKRSNVLILITTFISVSSFCWCLLTKGKMFKWFVLFYFILFLLDFPLILSSFEVFIKR